MAGNAIQTSVAAHDKMEHLEASYLAVHQGLEFSRAQQQDAAQRADIERRRLFLKYATSKTSVNTNFGGCLLKDDLEQYTNIVDNQSSLNNYWKQFDLLGVATSNDPLEWEFHTTDPNAAHEHAEPLPCQRQQNQVSTLECRNEQVLERDVEKVMSWWRSDEVSPRARKISRQEQNKAVVEQLAQSGRSVSDFEKNKSSKLLSGSAKQVPTDAEKQSFSDKTIANKVNAAAADRQADEKFTGFKTARAVYNVQQNSKHNRQAAANRHPYAAAAAAPTTTTTTTSKQAQPMKKSLGGKAFVCPLKRVDSPPSKPDEAEPTDERLKGIEPKMIELIKNEIMDCGHPIAWDDIAGLERAKRIIQEIVVYPMLRPDIFTGLRRPPKGILLFGPPGTGKTLIGKCIASQSKSTFFSISASSLTSKWVGEGEKMVRALFAVAQVEQPSVVFIDEIDSLLCQRSETEHESSRRMKTEFLVQLDGASTGDEDRILVIGATNRPHELDEAARRRLVKRLYIPLPELQARQQIIRNLLKSERHDLTEEDTHRIADLADGYSGADMTNLCKEASMGPIRSIPFDQLEGISKEDVRQVTVRDFEEALDVVRPSVSPKDLSVYLDWDRTYGTASAQARF